MSLAYDDKPIPLAELTPGSLGSEPDKERSLDGASSADGQAFDPSTSAGEMSAGVERIKLISQSMTPALRGCMLASTFLIAYTYGLDSSTRSTYLATATASYSTHSLLTTVNVFQSVVAAVSQPVFARVSDTFGRLSLIAISVLFWCIGTAVEASSSNVKAYAAGACIYQFGFSCIIMLLEIIVADLSSLRNRVFVTFLLPLPFVINTWVSGDVAASVLSVTTWRWGVGMWAIIYPASTLPLVTVLILARRRAQRSTHYNQIIPAYRKKGFVRALASELDIIGLFLLAAALLLILVPFTIAGGVSKSWGTAKIIAPLVLGFLMIPVFCLWEAKYASHPIIPASLLRDRTVICCFGIACLLNCSWYLQGAYLYTVAQVAFGESIKSATRIASLYSFTSALTGLAIGFVMRYVRRVKIFIFIGTLIYLLAWGLLIRFRGSAADRDGLIAGQVILGLAGGLFPYQAQALIQACASHENLAVITATYLSSYSLGSSLGNAASGALWTQVLPRKLEASLGDATLAASVYNDPFTFIAANPMGTAPREAVVVAYQQTQRLLCITGICLAVPLVLCAVLVRDVRMGDGQNIAELAEREKNEAR